MEDNPVFDEMMEALNGHQVTDDEGNIPEETETSGQDSSPENQTTVEDTAPGENPPEVEQSDSESEDTTNENQLAEDETGKKYVPEERFKQVYGKMKALERELATKQAMAPAPKQTGKQPKVDKAEMLENELLFTKFPQLDPNSQNYSIVLDEMAYDIYRANPGITKLDAARRAERRIREIAVVEARVKGEARTVKALQSDQGITNRSTSRGQTQLDPNSMTEAEMEEYLKKTGNW
jgi:hypothetical protein